MNSEQQRLQEIIIKRGEEQEELTKFNDFSQNVKTPDMDYRLPETRDKDRRKNLAWNTFSDLENWPD